MNSAAWHFGITPVVWLEEQSDYQNYSTKRTHGEARSEWHTLRENSSRSKCERKGVLCLCVCQGEGEKGGKNEGLRVQVSYFQVRSFCSHSPFVSFENYKIDVFKLTRY